MLDKFAPGLATVDGQKLPGIKINVNGVTKKWKAEKKGLDKFQRIRESCCCGEEIIF
jgi:hypothetical protein